jgi:hypothetical protein
VCISEHVAATTTVCQGNWLPRFLTEFSNIEAKQVMLKIDNKSAIAPA